MMTILILTMDLKLVKNKEIFSLLRRVRERILKKRLGKVVHKCAVSGKTKK